MKHRKGRATPGLFPTDQMTWPIQTLKVTDGSSEQVFAAPDSGWCRDRTKRPTNEGLVVLSTVGPSGSIRLTPSLMSRTK